MIKKLKLYFIAICLGCFTLAPNPYSIASPYSGMTTLDVTLMQMISGIDTSIKNQGCVISFNNSIEDSFMELEYCVLPPKDAFFSPSKVNCQLIAGELGNVKFLAQMIKNILQHFKPGNKFHVLVRPESLTELDLEFYIWKTPGKLVRQFLIQTGTLNLECLKFAIDRIAHDHEAPTAFVLLKKSPADFFPTYQQYDILLRQVPPCEGLSISSIKSGPTLAVFPDYIFAKRGGEILLANKKQETPKENDSTKQLREFVEESSKKSEQKQKELDILAKNVQAWYIKELQDALGDHHPYSQYSDERKNMYLEYGCEAREVKEKPKGKGVKVFKLEDPKLKETLGSGQWDKWVFMGIQDEVRKVYLKKNVQALLKELQDVFGLNHDFSLYLNEEKSILIRYGSETAEEAKTVPKGAKFLLDDTELRATLSNGKWDAWIFRNDKAKTEICLTKHKPKSAPQTPVAREAVVEELVPEAPIEIPSSSTDQPKMKAAEVPVEAFEIPAEALEVPELELDEDIALTDLTQKMPGTKLGKYYVKPLQRRDRETIYLCGKPDENMGNAVYPYAKLTQAIRNLRNGKDFSFACPRKDKIEIYKFVQCLNDSKDLPGIALKLHPDLEGYCGVGTLYAHGGNLYFKITTGKQRQFNLTTGQASPLA